jgi:hypothetical protein
MIIFTLFEKNGCCAYYKPVTISFDNVNVTLYARRQYNSIMLIKDDKDTENIEDSGDNAYIGKENIEDNISADTDRYTINEINYMLNKTIKEVIDQNTNGGKKIVFLCKGKEIPVFSGDMKKELISSISKFYQI